MIPNPVFPIRITVHHALATYLGAAVIAIWCIVRAWDHLRGRPMEPDPWAELPTVDPRTWAELPTSTYCDDPMAYFSPDPTSSHGGPVSIRWRQ